MIESFSYLGASITIEHDYNPESPRDWDNLGSLSMWHRRYTFPDDLGEDPTDYSGWAEMEESLLGRYACVLPVYMYEHSGIALQTTPFACLWDSGQVGFICLSREKLIEEYGKDTPETRQTAQAVLAAEVEIYSQYLNGEVYGYIVEYKHCRDSCWGFFGLDYCKQQAEKAAAYIVEHAMKGAEESLVTSAD